MYSINGEAIRCNGLRPLLGRYPLLGGSVIGGFTVVMNQTLSVVTVVLALTRVTTVKTT